ncbi:hypothetical protein F4804DRAFT_311906 [Jackrogersella minutella]|nr:hypothetical protein F4804DRAFT_311906 [Jackrogersella minutella]
MFHKTIVLSGLVAASGVMANNDGYSMSAPSYPTATYPVSSSAVVASYPSSKPVVSHPVTYPANVTAVAPTSVWQYYNTTIPTTVVVPVLTTVCPEATTLTYSGKHYTATKGQTVVVTDCPCTVTTTIPTITSSLCPPGVTPTAVAPALPGTMQTNTAAPAQGTPAGGSSVVVGTYGSSPENTVPAGAAPAVPNSPAATYPASPNAPASISAVHTATSSPNAVEISGAAGGNAGCVVALFAVFMAALAL